MLVFWKSFQNLWIVKPLYILVPSDPIRGKLCKRNQIGACDLIWGTTHFPHSLLQEISFVYFINKQLKMKTSWHQNKQKIFIGVKFTLEKIFSHWIWLLNFFNCNLTCFWETFKNTFSRVCELNWLLLRDGKFLKR